MTAVPGAAALAALFDVPPAWLGDALDGRTVADAARRGAVTGVEGEVVACEPLDVRLTGDGWRAWYALTVRGAGATERTVDVEGELVPPGSPGPPAAGPPALALRPPAPGAELPALYVLTDPPAAARLVERMLRAGPFPAVRVAGCSPRVVRHARGARVTVVLDLDLDLQAAPGAHPRPPGVVVAKAYRDAEGAATHAAMTGLWGSRLATHPDVAVAPPLGYDAALRVLLQGAVPHEQTLTELVVSAVGGGSPAALDRLRAAVRTTADGLVALHTSGAGGGPVKAPASLLGRADKAYRRLGRWVPGVAAAGEQVLAELASRAARVPADAPVPSHGGFRPAQVLLDHGDHPAFIDFDGFCTAEPGFDVGRFRARLREIVLATPTGPHPVHPRDRWALADRLADDFSDRYAAAAPISQDRVALWEQLELVTALVQSWTRGQVTRTPSLAALVAGSAG